MPLPIVAATFIAVAVPLVVKILIALGIGIVTYTGAGYAVDSAEVFLNSQLTGMPADAYAILAMAGLDVGIKIIFAAAAANISIKTAMGVFKRFTVL